MDQAEAGASHQMGSGNRVIGKNFRAGQMSGGQIRPMISRITHCLSWVPEVCVCVSECVCVLVCVFVCVCAHVCVFCSAPDIQCLRGQKLKDQDSSQVSVSPLLSPYKPLSFIGMKTVAPLPNHGLSSVS
jgi:hypothetical protein